MNITLDALRRYAVARSLFAPTTLPKAIVKLGFVQADPIRAPARAQDLTLRHRVKGYCAGDLERRYSELNIEEDFFVNYGFMPRHTQALMHPRSPKTALTVERRQHMAAVLDFVAKLGVVHPKTVDDHFAHGKSQNWFGGTSNASTQLLDDMHYRGMLRIAARANGVRTYAVNEAVSRYEMPNSTIDVSPNDALDALVDVIVYKYAPLPERSLTELMGYLLRGGAPQWAHLKRDAITRAKSRLASGVVDGQTYYWPANENPSAKKHAPPDTVRLLAPFDPVVWDRRRFEHLWGWAYRFEAYTPAPKRVRGYYALPLLWQEQVIGWANVSVKEGAMKTDLGYVSSKPPRADGFKQALGSELAEMHRFLNLDSAVGKETNHVR
jgi:uncharacterized protein